MIAPGDRIAVGVSGGKDSLLLLTLLARLRDFLPAPFSLHAVTLSMGFEGMDFAPLEAYCAALDVPFTLVPTNLGHVLFETRREKNPCALCANMRRGILHKTATALGCHKVALGHHKDDAVETFVMSLFFEGRISCFRPVTWLDRQEVTLIRPMLYIEEADIVAAKTRLRLPVVHNPCPANGFTKRQEVKELLESWGHERRDMLFGAMKRLPLPGWGQITDNR